MKKGDFAYTKLMGWLLLIALMIFIFVFWKGLREHIITAFDSFFDFMR